MAFRKIIYKKKYCKYNPKLSYINVIMLHNIEKKITHDIVVHRGILKPTLHNFVKIQKVFD